MARRRDGARGKTAPSCVPQHRRTMPSTSQYALRQRYHERVHHLTGPTELSQPLALKQTYSRTGVKPRGRRTVSAPQAPPQNLELTNGVTNVARKAVSCPDLAEGGHDASVEGVGEGRTGLLCTARGAAGKDRATAILSSQRVGPVFPRSFRWEGVLN